jgi:hypothetical protein
MGSKCLKNVSVAECLCAPYGALILLKPFKRCPTKPSANAANGLASIANSPPKCVIAVSRNDGCVCAMIRAVVFKDEPMAAQHLATLLDDLPKR